MTSSASAPASSANLGPGFDVVGLAYEMRCRVSAKHATKWSVTEEGSTYEPEPDTLVVQAATAVTGQPLALSIDNDIPRARGLGSSAAVATAIAAAAIRVGGREPDSEELLELVARLEGHYDNAAATVLGGCVVAFEGRVLRLRLHPSLVFLAAVPSTPLATSEARGALPDMVERSVAARSLARVAFLVEGLRTADPAAFAGAAGDEMHEGLRAGLSPATGALMQAAYAAGALHAAWSGAGPTALAITTAPAAAVVARALADELGGAGTVMALDVATRGWQ